MKLPDGRREVAGADPCTHRVIAYRRCMYVVDAYDTSHTTYSYTLTRPSARARRRTPGGLFAGSPVWAWIDGLYVGTSRILLAGCPLWVLWVRQTGLEAPGRRITSVVGTVSLYILTYHIAWLQCLPSNLLGSSGWLRIVVCCRVAQLKQGAVVAQTCRRAGDGSGRGRQERSWGNPLGNLPLLFRVPFTFFFLHLLLSPCLCQRACVRLFFLSPVASPVVPSHSHRHTVGVRLVHPGGEDCLSVCPLQVY